MPEIASGDHRVHHLIEAMPAYITFTWSTLSALSRQVQNASRVEITQPLGNLCQCLTNIMGAFWFVFFFFFPWRSNQNFPCCNFYIVSHPLRAWLHPHSLPLGSWSPHQAVLAPAFSSSGWTTPFFPGSSCVPCSRSKALWEPCALLTPVSHLTHSKDPKAAHAQHEHHKINS